MKKVLLIIILLIPTLAQAQQKSTTQLHIEGYIGSLILENISLTSRIEELNKQVEDLKKKLEDNKKEQK